MDRLPEIASRWTGPEGGHRYWDASDDQIADAAWLIAEVMRLREALEEWKCRHCDGTGFKTYFGHARGEICWECEGDHLSPTAHKALNFHDQEAR